MAALEQRFELAGFHEHALGVRLLGAGVRGVGKLMPGEEDLRPGVAEVEGHLALLEQAGHRHDDRAGAKHTVVADREIRDVGQHDPDSVPRLDALGAQETGRAGSGGVERGVGQLGVIEFYGHAVGALGGAAAE